MLLLENTECTRVGFTRVDVKNYISKRRQRSMAYDDVGCISQYFQRRLLENPSLFHAYQMYIEEQMTNVFCVMQIWFWITGILVMLCHRTLHIVPTIRINCMLCFLVSTTARVRSFSCNTGVWWDNWFS